MLSLDPFKFLNQLTRNAIFKYTKKQKLYHTKKLRNTKWFCNIKKSEQTAHKIFVLFWKFLAISLWIFAIRFWLRDGLFFMVICTCYVAFSSILFIAYSIGHLWTTFSLTLLYQQHTICWCENKNIEWINKCEPAQHRIQNKFMDEKIRYGNI